MGLNLDSGVIFLLLIWNGNCIKIKEQIYSICHGLMVITMVAFNPLQQQQQQQSSGMDGFGVLPSQYNPLDEPSPLGLRLRKSPSLLELIQMKLSQPSSVPKVGSPSNSRKECSRTVGASGDKLKASNFPGSVLKIGTWEVIFAFHVSSKL